MKDHATKERPGRSSVSGSTFRAPGRSAPRDAAARAEIRRLLDAASVRCQVAVGPPDDTFEREADAVAARVAAGQRAPRISRLPATGSPPPDEDEPVRRKAANELAEEEEQPVQRHASSGGVMAGAAQRAIDSKGPGRSLDPPTRSRLESGLGTDLSDVRVHDDAAAHESARALNARAFTHGSDIWLGAGESANDVRLMAHEATHVVQQSGAVQRDVVQRTNGDAAGAPPAPEVPGDQLPLATGRVTDDHTIAFAEIEVPTFKASAHRAALYTSHALKRRRAYDRGNPGQRDKWKNEVGVAPEIRTILEGKIKRAHHVDAVDPAASYVFETPVSGSRANPFVFGRFDTIAKELSIPTWGGTGSEPPLKFYQVDHIVELQLANWPEPDAGWANELGNMELLEGDLNEESGRTIRANIERKVQQFLGVTGTRFGTSVADIKQRYDLAFDRAVSGGGARATRADYWTKDEIRTGRHLGPVRARDLDVLGRSGRLRVFPTETGGLGKTFVWPGELTRVERQWLKPFEITRKSFNTDSEEAGTPFGSLLANVPADHPDWEPLEADEAFEVDRIPGARYAGVIRKAAVLQALHRLRKKDASPVRIDTFDLLPDQGIVVAGAVLPELPLFRDIDLRFELSNGYFRLYKEFVGGELSVPPPFLIRGTSLKVFADTRTGFGAEGRVDFGIDNVGEGFVAGEASTGGGLAFAGGFDFESDVFDPASVRLAYRDGVFSGSGEIGIPEGKLAGVKSARLHIAIEGERISGSGTVEPAIRAIRQGTIDFSYSPEAGLAIGGTLELSDEIPNVQAGSVQVRIAQRPEAEEWDLSAHGEVQAGVPGFTATVTADYVNGLFTVEGRGDYARGMMAGSILVGATNRAVDEAGNLGDTMGEGVVAYGGGTVTVRISPWLQGTVGICFLPNGELELSGEIALPAALDLFPEYSYERNIFPINLDIPIVGVAVAGQRIGIFATIGGGLDLSAGVGPGQLRELRLGITYNPDHEDQTHVTGDALLVIPAHAGLRLFVRGALGVGIPVISAELGLEVGGELGLAGALETGVHINWTPAIGLVLDARAEIYVEPKFRFDLTGFLEVTADLFITEITLYARRWELAAFELSTGYRLGMIFPFHYEQGQPVAIDWSAVEFVYPDIDAGEILDQLVERIA